MILALVSTIKLLVKFFYDIDIPMMYTVNIPPSLRSSDVIVQSKSKFNQMKISIVLVSIVGYAYGIIIKLTKGCLIM